MGARRDGRRFRSVTPARAALHGLDRALGALDLLAKGFVGLALLAITATLFAGAFGRYALNASFVGGEELARYLMVWMTFIGSYILVREQRHIAIDVLLRALPAALQRWMAVAIGVVGAVTMAYLTWHGYELAQRMLVGGQLSPVLPVPRGLLHVSLPVGAAMMTLGFVHMTLSHLIEPEAARPLLDAAPVEE